MLISLLTKRMSQHSIVQLQTLLSVVKVATGTLKMCFSTICVGRCSSIRHTDWCKPHWWPLMAPNPSLPLPPHPLPQERQACAVTDCSVPLTRGLSAYTPGDSKRHSSACHTHSPFFVTGMCPETPLFRLHGLREKKTRVYQTLCCQAECTKSSYIPRRFSNWNITNKDAIFSTANGIDQKI